MLWLVDSACVCCRLGSKTGRSRTCEICKGRGVTVHLRPLGPGMVQQLQATCSNCDGEGNLRE